MSRSVCTVSVVALLIIRLKSGKVKSKPQQIYNKIVRKPRKGEEKQIYFLSLLLIILRESRKYCNLAQLFCFNSFWGDFLHVAKVLPPRKKSFSPGMEKFFPGGENVVPRLGIYVPGLGTHVSGLGT